LTSDLALEVVVEWRDYEYEWGKGTSWAQRSQESTIRPKGESLGLYERLLKEREEEERRRGRPLGHFYGLGSPVLDGLLANAPEDRPKKYGADLRKLHWYIRKGVHSPGAGMRYASLKQRHPQAYRELKAEAQGQGELT
jgi:hypothetical protein